MFLTTKRAYFSRCCLFFFLLPNQCENSSDRSFGSVEKIIFLDNFDCRF